METETIEVEIDPVETETKLSVIQTVDELIWKILRHELPLSFSSLSNFAENPADFIAYKFGQIDTTPAMLYGQMLHCLVLEPNDFYNRYFVLDDDEQCKKIGGAKPRATTAYKEWKAEMISNARGKTLVTSAEFDVARSISIGVKFNKASARILNLCPDREQRFEFEYSNYKFKGIKDGTGQHATFDLKSCRDANPRKFMHDVMNSRYYLQAAIYNHHDGDPYKPYYWIAVDQKGGISCHECKKTMLQKGKDEFEYLVNRFSECVLKDRWTESYEFFADRYDGIYDANRPGWA